MDSRRVLIRAAIATGLLLLVACGKAAGGGTASPAPSTPGSTPTATATAARIVFVRSGGFAGVQQRLEVHPQGNWTYTEHGKDAADGHFTAKQAHRLQRLGTSSALDVAVEKGLKRETCPDAFQYSLTVGSRTLTWGQCHGQPSRPLLATTRLLIEHTPM